MLPAISFSFRNIFDANFCIGAAETEIDRQIERFIFITVLIIICVPVLVLQTRVVDPWHFVTDPDPRIRTNLRIRNQIRILLFWSGLKDVFAYYFLKLHLHYRVPGESSKIKRPKEEEVPKQQKSKFFLLFFLDDGKIRIWETQKPPEPDLQYCFRHVFFFLDAFKPAFQARWHSLHYEYYLVSTWKSKD